MNSLFQRMLRGRFLVAAISAVLIWPGLALAQDSQSGADEETVADDSAFEEIVVTGYRSSIRTGNEIKRNADYVVDAIVATEIGKLPDSNVAEALQRVTGVQIERERGEGTRVAIRGLSADLNRAEINGMAFAGTGTSREADFRNVPSDFISSIEVIKSPTASMTDSAVGGWINIHTRRPFDNEGLKLSGSFKMRGGPGADTAVTDEYSPEISFFVSNTFSDKIGASFTYHAVQHESRQDILEDLFWSYLDVDGDGDSEYFPHLPRYFQSIVSEERSAYTGSIQLRPSDDLELILDVTHSERDTEIHNLVNNFINWIAPPTNIVEINDTVVGFSVADAWFQSLSSEFEENRETDTVSLTAGWGVSERAKISGLFGVSRGEYDNPLFNAVPTMPGTGPITFSEFGRDNVWRSDFDLVAQGQDGSSFPWFLMSHSQQLIEQEEALAQVDVEFDVDWGAISSFKAGAQYRDTSFDSVGVELPRNFFSLADARAFIGNDSVYDSFLANVMQPIPGVFGDVYDGNPGVPPTFWVPDTDLVMSTFYTAEEIANLRNYDESVLTYGKVWDIEENISAIYFQADIDTTVGGLTLSGNFGVRIVQTDTSTNGFGNADVNDPVHFDTDYTDVLPALNLRLDLNDEMLLRLAASQVIARPTITDLVPRLTYNSVQLEASGGNPELDPFRADQIDLVFEYYPSEDTAVAVGVFYKDVKSFVENQIVARDLFGDGNIYRFSTPVNGEGAKIKGVELTANHVFTNLPSFWSGLGVSANYTYVDSTSLSESQVTGEKLPFPGLSETSYNLAVFYENYGFSSRLAYNYRDERLATSTGSGVFPLVTPIYYDEYASLDASISYSFFVKEQTAVALFVSGTNLTDENQRQSGEGGLNRNVTTYAWGRTYEAGVRVTFQ
ncbi:MAG: TonB-dependent receptor [Woeseiaceae bacterium]|nr:TonB-dependent receptor [Woeseiaceae bacterium]